MIRQARTSTTAIACLAALLAATGIAMPAAAAGSLKAAHVEEVIPAHTFTGHMQVLDATKSIDPSNGITCIAAEVTTLLHGGSVEIDVDGVVN